MADWLRNRGVSTLGRAARTMHPMEMAGMRATKKSKSAAAGGTATAASGGSGVCGVTTGALALRAL